MEDWTFVGKKAKSISSGKKQQQHSNGAKSYLQQQRDKKNVNNNNHNHEMEENTRTDVECQQIVSEACKSLMRTDFRLLMFESLFPPLGTCHTLIGLGLGQIISSPSSLLQLAFTLSLRDECRRLLSPEGNIQTFSTTVFDPMFSSLERRLCESFHLSVSVDNKKGMHRACGSTIFFMPHCPYRLYCNLLWENWDNLEHVFIIGNSFSSYSLRRSLLSRAAESSIEDRTDCIRLLGDLVTEIPLWELYWESHKKGKGKGYKHSGDLDLSQLEGAFCDTSLHYFKKETLISSIGQRILSAQPCREDMEEAAKYDVELFSDEYDTSVTTTTTATTTTTTTATTITTTANTTLQKSQESTIATEEVIKPNPTEEKTTKAVETGKEEEIIGTIEFAPLFATNILPMGTLKVPSGRRIQCQTRSVKTFNDLLFVDDIWPGSRCLVDYLMKNVQLYRGRTVLELGAGAALPGLVVAADGASFTLITDFPAPGVIENIDRLITLNQLSNVSAMGHVWGADNVATLLQESMMRITRNDMSVNDASLSPPATAATAATSSWKGFDVVLMAELLWKDTYIHHRALLESVVGTLKKDGVAYAAFAHRPTRGTNLSPTLCDDLSRQMVSMPLPVHAFPTTSCTLDQAHIPPPPPPPTTTAPQHTSHTTGNDLEFFSMAESIDFNLVCEQISSCRQYCDVGGDGDPIEVKIFTLRFR